MRLCVCVFVVMVRARACVCVGVNGSGLLLNLLDDAIDICPFCLLTFYNAIAMLLWINRYKYLYLHLQML